MTPQQEWEADYFEEQMNELISIFRSLNAKDIEYSIIESANPTFFIDLNGGDKIDNVISIKL